MVSVKVNDLTKKFGAFTAVNRISFQVNEGEVFGFLGPNGAGKSTTIKMLCGILAPTEGEAIVAGYNVSHDPEPVKKNIGYMSQRFSLYEDLTVEENLRFYAGIYEIPRAKLADRIRDVLSVTDLAGKEKIAAAALPKGWKQRLALGCAIIHHPPVLFLDEPTSGVDPISRRRFWDLIGLLSCEGTTVFVTTHFMDEAEHCNHIAFIAGGRLASLGTPTELKGNSGSASLEEAFVYYASIVL
ncbi:MAG: ABC transporter ATP-binding protein [Bacillota bacterium]